MPNMSDFLENKLIDALFRGTAYTPPTTLYIALTTTAPTDATTGAAGGAEPADAAYARQSVVGAVGNWWSTGGQTTGASTGTSGTTSNVAAITFPAATANWGTVVGVLLTDAAGTGAGNALFWGTLTSNKVVSTGDTFQFAAGSLSIQIDN
jgi:hypothetical protein